MSLSKWPHGRHIGFCDIRNLLVACFLGRNLHLLQNFNFKFHVHVVCVYGQKRIDFHQIDFHQIDFWRLSQNFSSTLQVCMGRSLLILRYVAVKMAAWWPYWIFRFSDCNLSLALNFKSKLLQHISCVYWQIEGLQFWRMFNCNPCIVQ